MAYYVHSILANWLWLWLHCGREFFVELPIAIFRLPSTRVFSLLFMSPRPLPGLDPVLERRKFISFLATSQQDRREKDQIKEQISPRQLLAA